MKVNFLELLTLVFVVFKLLGAIDWGWFVVFFPYILHMIKEFLCYISTKDEWE